MNEIKEKVIVEMPFPKDNRWRSWAKLLTDVNEKEANGYAFKGTFLPLSDAKRNAIVKRELEVGSIIMIYEEEGSQKYHKPLISLYEVQTDGKLKLIYEHKCKGFSWTLEVRDDIKKILDNKKIQNKEEKKKLLLEKRNKLIQELQKIEEELKKMD
jgi:hypothetical protein